jgi:chromosome segregation ATPase
MTFTFDAWQLLTIAATLAGGFWAMAKVLAMQISKTLDAKFENFDERFVQLERQMTTQSGDSRRIERELLELKAELPREYTRREDFTRVQATIEVKIDNVRLLIERLLTRENSNGA